MPKMSQRDRLTKLEARQRKVADEVEVARRDVRGSYAALVSEMAVETFTEREFRDVLTQILRVGPVASLAALKALPEVRP